LRLTVLDNRHAGIGRPEVDADRDVVRHAASTSEVGASDGHTWSPPRCPPARGGPGCYLLWRRHDGTRWAEASVFSPRTRTSSDASFSRLTRRPSSGTAHPRPP